MKTGYYGNSNKEIASEIGSYFYYGYADLIKNGNNTLNDSYTYLSTCRSAIFMILSQLGDNNKIAMVPAFTCSSVVKPFVDCGYTVEPYSINKDFIVNEEQFLKNIDKINPDVILIHDYFGFDSNYSLKESFLFRVLKEKGKIIIVDRTQSMFSSYKQLSGDYTVGSLRKWFGIPDGAFVSSIQAYGLCEDTELVNAKRKAMNYKDLYIRYGKGNKENIIKLYREAESILNSRNKVYAMAEESKKLFSNVDLHQMCARRRRNYKRLADRIENTKYIDIPHPYLNDSEVPFYFPIFVKKNRIELQKYLAKNNIYATIIWGCPDVLLKKIDIVAREIYQEILCIPCDQRYNQVDMDYICEKINNYI